ncbi:succinate dehydrogenase, hydrophobic membrane anchor protein [Echinimonas agarilytica]|uniref:Succinate dehydrogenase hydrophobic membrane anchor subunit n=1 Tax=Echinimonas agarilytica TaxID=1215918 RepID=A0AA41W6G8_9GAMM|nr:succinate dehydrogenase, hydrophobic membrane anchor protein [Echinimonas agarilytica]MCM2679950.1 succinate dehydrogenase, hydrophobic membrane anchor protein [Echinimonas agarilytica]
MVMQASSLGRNGVQDFILLRCSAILLLAYTIYIVGYLVCTPEMTYEVWSGFFACMTTKVFTLITLIAFLVHAWIGLWQVLTDYVKPAGLRGSLQFVLNVVILAIVASGIFVLWGV